MPVAAAAFVPGAPALVPLLTGGAAAELGALREASDGALADVLRMVPPQTRVVVLGRGSVTRAHDGSAWGTLGPWGVDLYVGAAGQATGDPLPLALTVGAWLLDRADIPSSRRGYQEVAGDGPIPDAPADEVALLVVGEGSSTRTPKAPGAFHPEAESYDAAAAAALATGDPAALAALDDDRAARVGAAGARAWAVAAAWWGEQGAGTSRVTADEAPYGVGYLVGVWTRGQQPG